jgi:glutaredoxin
MRYLVAAALLAAASSAAGQVYRWTDSSGKTHFTDRPPPASAKDVQMKRAAEPTEGDDAAKSAHEPYALQHARQTSPVKLYSAPSCAAACEEARALLTARGVPFTEVSVASEAALAQLKEASGATSVPVLVVGSTVERGFDPGAYQRSLDAAGYPKSGVLPRGEQGGVKQRQRFATPPATAPDPGPYAPRPR